MNPDLNAHMRFSDRVDAYGRSRPGYPAALYDRLLTGRRPDTDRIAEIGSGTGIFSRELLRRGYAVAGVEPNAEMRAAAEKSQSGWPRFESIAGSAEDTGLDATSIDLLVSAQAFHWFDFEKTRIEATRILRPGGTVAWVWNSRRVSGTAFAEAYERFLERWATDYLAVRESYAVRERLGAFFPGSPLGRAVFDNHQTLDHHGFRLRVLSASYMPSEADARHSRMLDAIDRLFAEHQQGGQVRLRFDAELFWQHAK